MNEIKSPFIVTLDEMKEIERVTFSEMQFPEELIIENVGISGAQYLDTNFLSKGEYDGIVVLIGLGNNGSDGLAIARHLVNRGHAVEALLLFPEQKDRIKGELKKQLQYAQSFGVGIVDTSDVGILQENLEQFDHPLIVDAIMGTGIRLPLDARLSAMISFVNASMHTVVSIDIPTGVHGDEGMVDPVAIRAALTLTIGVPKLGLFVEPGSLHVGKVEVLDAGFPWYLLQSEKISLVQREAWLRWRENIERVDFGHKNDFGNLLVIGGSPGMSGAPILTAMSALRIGTGLVSICAYEKHLGEILSRAPSEIMGKNLEGLNSERLNKFDVVCIGPGWSQSEERAEILKKILQVYRRPIILDADALNLIAEYNLFGALAEREALTILTPHGGEFQRLTGMQYFENKNKLDLLRNKSKEWHSIIILKGANTFVAFPDERLLVLHAPNAALSTAGSGDVLAGMLSGLIAQMVKKSTLCYKQGSEVISPEEFEQHASGAMLEIGAIIEAALAAHSYCGMMAEKKLGKGFVNSSDLLNFLATNEEK